LRALIDGDIVAIRTAATAENEELWIATSRASSLIDEIITAVKADSVEIWLSGDTNFRYRVYPEYKASRLGMKRPKWEKEVKQYLSTDWNANWSVDCEADDMLGVGSTEDTIICTIDKDLNQIPGLHYNFVKKEIYEVDYLEGMRFFYQQMLTGDTVDNIKGVSGIGAKKAEKLLSQGETEEEWYDIVRDQYSCNEEMELNGQCLWIWRKLNDIWKLKSIES